MELQRLQPKLKTILLRTVNRYYHFTTIPHSQLPSAGALLSAGCSPPSWRLCICWRNAWICALTCSLSRVAFNRSCCCGKSEEPCGSCCCWDSWSRVAGSPCRICSVSWAKRRVSSEVFVVPRSLACMAASWLIWLCWPKSIYSCAPPSALRSACKYVDNPCCCCCCCNCAVRNIAADDISAEKPDNAVGINALLMLVSCMPLPSIGFDAAIKDDWPKRGFAPNICDGWRPNGCCNWEATKSYGWPCPAAGDWRSWRFCWGSVFGNRAAWFWDNKSDCAVGLGKPCRPGCWVNEADPLCLLPTEVFLGPEVPLPFFVSSSWSVSLESSGSSCVVEGMIFISFKRWGASFWNSGCWKASACFGKVR